MVKVDDQRKVAVLVVTNELREGLAEELREEDEGGTFWQRVRKLAGGDEEESRVNFCD